MINFFIFVLKNLGDFIQFYLIMPANFKQKERYGS
ncbi:signal transduction protein [Campylobacter concisus]|uniref:Signal transduction protein n=1 Tax=Campylobacter concisus TaxID=199 RepID=A0A1Y5MVR4_9BACT|nr:signal transduction protein [Campylobacter concisus]OUT14062.1 signal transduction protein [Campylobacter concisus]OUT19112.1 signal transduction protein [Campylobacter concisus]